MNVSMKCPWYLPIGPKRSCLISLLYADWSEASLWNLPGVWRSVLKDIVSMVLWMIVVLDSGLDALVTVTVQTFGRTQVCFNDVLVWLSMNPPAVYLVKYISHNSCLPELSIAEVQYIPSNYGQVYKKTPKLSQVREQEQCMCSQCGNALDLASETSDGIFSLCEAACGGLSCWVKGS